MPTLDVCTLSNIRAASSGPGAGTTEPFSLRVFPSTAGVHLLPLATVGLPDFHRLHRARIKASGIDTEAVRV